MLKNASIAGRTKTRKSELNPIVKCKKVLKLLEPNLSPKKSKSTVQSHALYYGKQFKNAKNGKMCRQS